MVKKRKRNLAVIELQKKYKNNLINITEASEITGLVRETIYKYIKKYKIETIRLSGERLIYKRDLKPIISLFKDCNTSAEKIHKVRQNNFHWTKKMKELLDGAILGDGYLNKYKNRPLIDAYFVLTSNSKEHCIYIINNLPIGLFHKNQPTSRNIKKGKHYRATSRSDIYLTNQLKRWYPKGRKIIPKDLKLTPTMCHHWYICDGSLSNRENRKGHIHLYTDYFTKIEIQKILIKQMMKLGFECKVFKHYHPIDKRRGYAIRINTKSTKKFLDYIGLPIINYYKYKWNWNKKYFKECCQDNKEKRKKCDKKYYQKNKEKILKCRKEYYQENREQILKQKKEYYQKNRDQILKSKKKVKNG